MIAKGNDPNLGELVAIDQSLNSPGIALFRSGVLVGSAVLKQKHETHWPIGARVSVTSRDLLRWVAAYTRDVRMVAIEWPQVYNYRNSKGDPNDLLPVAAVGGAVATGITLLYQDRAVEIRSPKPADWSGQIPKYTTGAVWESPRARRILGRLAKHERDIVSVSHDALDAIGIGLWVLGRLDAVKIFPGAT